VTMSERQLVEISSGRLSAQIDPLGAQLHSLRDHAERDLQWSGDPAIWKGRAPILFPIVGALAGNKYTLDGQTYSLSKHGFARDRMFSVEDTSATSALFRLKWDQETLQVYPFRFQLDLRFELAATTLHIAATVKNLDGTKALPACFGYHPAFCWPLPYGQPRASHFIEFEMDEPSRIRRLDSQGLLIPTKFQTPVSGRTLALHDDLFRADAIIMDRIQSRRVTYGAARGPRLEVELGESPYLGIWTKPGAGFVCIEPWHGLADPQGYTGDFRAKPGMTSVEPGAVRDFTMSISLIG